MSPPPLAGLVLAAGAGTRLRPLSDLRPKPLCPVGFDALLDLALGRLDEALSAGHFRVAGIEGGALGASDASRSAGVDSLAVNLCHGAASIDAHLRNGPFADRVHRSFEPVALGTAGAVAPLRPWLDGRDLLIVNGDTWCPASLAPLVAAFEESGGERITVAVSGEAPLHSRSRIVGSILPWADVCRVPDRPAGLWELFWRDRLAAGELISVGIDGAFVDCATPADYLRANLEALAAARQAVGGGDAPAVGGTLVHPSAELTSTASVVDSVIGAGAVVAGRLRRCVVWPAAVVEPGEDLVDCIRTDAGTTVSGVASAPRPG